MTEQPCLNCGHLLGKKDKVCKSCGTKAGLSQPIYAARAENSQTIETIDYDSQNINIVSKGGILRRIIKLLFIVSFIGLIVVAPLHIAELQRTDWVSPVERFHTDSTEESINLFFFRGHTYQIHLEARNSFKQTCGLTTIFSVQDTNNIVLFSETLSDNTEPSGESSCWAYTSTNYEFEAVEDIWLKVNITIVQFITAWNSIDISVYEDPQAYDAPEIEMWFTIFSFTFLIIFVPLAMYKTFKLMFSFNKKFMEFGRDEREKARRERKIE